jgi:glyoxylase-like metal-dependent hydrolase (beta-lactamase superfamily II)
MSNTNHNVLKIAPKTWRIDEFGLDTMYLLEGDERALLIDTGTGVADLRALVEKLTDKPYDVAATHGHSDHVGGCVQFPSMYIHPDDVEMAHPTLEGKQNYAQRILERYPTDDAGFTVEDIVDGPLPEMIPLREGHVFSLGGRDIEVLEVPGHTRGSVVFLDRKNKLLFSGDAVNPIFLLVMPAPTREDAVRDFAVAAKRLRTLRGEAFTASWGGHDVNDPIDPRVLDDLITCAEGILDGTIQAAQKKIHIFDAPFYSVGTANIVTTLHE